MISGVKSDDTISSYLNALRKIFVIEDSEAWCPALRSKAVLRMSPTRYFSDPSIATTALGLVPGDLMNDIRAYGWFFESMAVRDLRVYADALNGSMSHYLDRNGLECDAVVHLRNGTSGLVEVKLGGSALIEDGARICHVGRPGDVAERLAVDQKAERMRVGRPRLVGTRVERGVRAAPALQIAQLARHVEVEPRGVHAVLPYPTPFCR